MSTRIMDKCWDLQMSPVAKTVLISLADQANDDGFCWPSVGNIVKRTCLSERSVQRAIAWLAVAKIVNPEERPGRSTVYTITPANFAPPPDSHPGAPAPTPDPLTPIPPPDSHPPPATQTPRTVIEPSGEPSRKAARPTRAPKQAQNRDPFTLPDWIPAAAWDGFVEMRQKIRKPATARACTLIVAELEKLRAEGHDPGPVLNQSTRNDWQDVYPIKVKTNGNGHHGGNGSAPAPIADGKIACRKCGNRVGAHTDRLCDPCYRTR